MILELVGLILITFFVYKITRSEPDKTVVKKESYSPPVMSDRRVQLIPRIIVQTNEKDYIPKDMKKAMDKLIQDNPEYVYYYFNNANAEKFIKN